MDTARHLLHRRPEQLLEAVGHADGDGDGDRDGFSELIERHRYPLLSTPDDIHECAPAWFRSTVRRVRFGKGGAGCPWIALTIGAHVL